MKVRACLLIISLSLLAALLADFPYPPGVFRR